MACTNKQSPISNIALNRDSIFFRLYVLNTGAKLTEKCCMGNYLARNLVAMESVRGKGHRGTPPGQPGEHGKKPCARKRPSLRKAPPRCAQEASAAGASSSGFGDGQTLQQLAESALQDRMDHRRSHLCQWLQHETAHVQQGVRQ